MKNTDIPAASFVLTSKIGLPRCSLLARWGLFVSQTLISPQSLLKHVMYKKLPSPDIVSWEQLDNWGMLPHVLHPLSRAFVKTSNSTTRLPVNKNPFHRYYLYYRSPLVCQPLLLFFGNGFVISLAFRFLFTFENSLFYLSVLWPSSWKASMMFFDGFN